MFFKSSELKYKNVYEYDHDNDMEFITYYISNNNIFEEVQKENVNLIAGYIFKETQYKDVVKNIEFTGKILQIVNTKCVNKKDKQNIYARIVDRKIRKVELFYNIFIIGDNDEFIIKKQLLLLSKYEKEINKKLQQLTRESWMKVHGYSSYCEEGGCPYHNK